MTSIEELTEQLKSARGPEYTARLKYILKLLGPEIKADFAAFKEAFGKITPVDIGIIVIKHNLNYKAVCEYLQHEHLLPAGLYERLVDSGMKVNEVLDASRVKLAVILSLEEEE